MSEKKISYLKELQKGYFKDGDWYDSYQNAFQQIKQGKKTSHWIWYVFPQIDGIGQKSDVSKQCAVKDLNEAIEILKNGEFRSNLVNITKELYRVIMEEGKTLTDIFPNTIDITKLKSSMTLFEQAYYFINGEDIKHISNGEDNIFTKMLDDVFVGERCEKTIKKINYEEFKLKQLGKDIAIFNEEFSKLADKKGFFEKLEYFCKNNMIEDAKVFIESFIVKILNDLKSKNQIRYLSFNNDKFLLLDDYSNRSKMKLIYKKNAFISNLLPKIITENLVIGEDNILKPIANDAKRLEVVFSGMEEYYDIQKGKNRDKNCGIEGGLWNLKEKKEEENKQGKNEFFFMMIKNNDNIIKEIYEKIKEYKKAFGVFHTSDLPPSVISEIVLYYEYNKRIMNSKISYLLKKSGLENVEDYKEMRKEIKEFVDLNFDDYNKEEKGALASKIGANISKHTQEEQEIIAPKEINEKIYLRKLFDFLTNKNLSSQIISLNSEEDRHKAVKLLYPLLELLQFSKICDKSEEQVMNLFVKYMASFSKKTQTEKIKVLNLNSTLLSGGNKDIKIFDSVIFPILDNDKFKKDKDRISTGFLTNILPFSMSQCIEEKLKEQEGKKKEKQNILFNKIKREFQQPKTFNKKISRNEKIYDKNRMNNSMLNRVNNYNYSKNSKTSILNKNINQIYSKSSPIKTQEQKYNIGKTSLSNKNTIVNSRDVKSKQFKNKTNNNTIEAKIEKLLTQIDTASDTGALNQQLNQLLDEQEKRNKTNGREFVY